MKQNVFIVCLVLQLNLRINLQIIDCCVRVLKGLIIKI